MIDFIKHDEHLLMRYTPERGDADWLVMADVREPTPGDYRRPEGKSRRRDFEDLKGKYSGIEVEMLRRQRGKLVLTWAAVVAIVVSLVPVSFFLRDIGPKGKLESLDKRLSEQEERIAELRVQLLELRHSNAELERRLKGLKAPE
jgi:cell division protein FtsL